MSTRLDDPAAGDSDQYSTDGDSEPDPTGEVEYEEWELAHVQSQSKPPNSGSGSCEMSTAEFGVHPAADVPEASETIAPSSSVIGVPSGSDSLQSPESTKPSNSGSGSCEMSTAEFGVPPAADVPEASETTAPSSSVIGVPSGNGSLHSPESTKPSNSGSGSCEASTAEFGVPLAADVPEASETAASSSSVIGVPGGVAVHGSDDIVLAEAVAGAEQQFGGARRVRAYVPAVGLGEIFCDVYAPAIGAGYTNWILRWQQDGTKREKKRIVNVGSTSRHGHIEPIAFVHACRDLTMAGDPRFGPRSRGRPTSGEVDALVARHRDQYEELHAMFL